jgi:hypothetical protein
LLSTIIVLPLITPGGSHAEGASRFQDEEQHYSIDVPAGWMAAEGVATGAVATRKVQVFHAPGDLETNLSVVSTNASVELGSVGSLGTPYEFAFRLVASQTSMSKKRKQIATLIDSKSLGDSYQVEYTIERPSEGIARHLYSVVCLRFDGKYNRFFTVTGQHRSGEEGQLGALVRDAVRSFKLTPLEL